MAGGATNRAMDSDPSTNASDGGPMLMDAATSVVAPLGSKFASARFSARADSLQTASSAYREAATTFGEVGAAQMANSLGQQAAINSQRAAVAGTTTAVAVDVVILPLILEVLEAFGSSSGPPADSGPLPTTVVPQPKRMTPHTR
jgi:hypothetical protein